MYILDTDVVSALRRPERNPVVSAWVHNQPPDGLYTSVITVGESCTASPGNAGASLNSPRSLSAGWSL